ncbi:hypothetical protein J5N97_013811 [Dioscorea zingiberensis]|uniref:TNase-like domain-containing protein n=1 Tax=Dioscorea zingiberensis TaxID=325984 RepID=A0A9D5CST1_9LILI|nr:hypothetical protein J5N97_013811 [Dioscorea zingiberensis]
MGNSLLKLIRECLKPSSTHESQPQAPPGVSPGVSALVHDLLHFDVTSQVPEELGQHVVSSKKAQANWYKKLLEAWRDAKPPPRTPEEASRLVIQTLRGHKKADVEGLLAFYGLPGPQFLPEISKYEFQTLPVDPKAVADGDTITVYVDISSPRESGIVPREVHEAAIERDRARAAMNYKEADALQKIMVAAGYRVINLPNGEEILARKYRIRLRGIDAPEGAMPYGKEAKEELVKMVQGKTLKISVYGDDRYGRCVGDIYCNGVYVQEQMLRRGCAWHYAAYDQRPELAKWEAEARKAHRGLWATPNPEKPWDWRKERRNGT